MGMSAQSYEENGEIFHELDLRSGYNRPKGEPSKIWCNQVVIEVLKKYIIDIPENAKALVLDDFNFQSTTSLWENFPKIQTYISEKDRDVFQLMMTKYSKNIPKSVKLIEYGDASLLNEEKNIIVDHLDICSGYNKIYEILFERFNNEIYCNNSVLRITSVMPRKKNITKPIFKQKLFAAIEDAVYNTPYQLDILSVKDMCILVQPSFNLCATENIFDDRSKAFTIIALISRNDECYNEKNTFYNAESYL